MPHSSETSFFRPELVVSERSSLVSHERASWQRAASVGHRSLIYLFIMFHAFLTYQILLRTPGWRTLGPLKLILLLYGQEFSPPGVFLCILSSTYEILEP